MGPEAKVENHLRLRVKKAGGMCVKLMPTIAGIPDRMVLLPGGKIRFVELKSSTGLLRPVQRVMHDRLYDLGFPVEVLRTNEAVDAWVKMVVDS